MGTVLLGSPGASEQLAAGAGHAYKAGMSRATRLSARKRTKADVCEKFIASVKDRTDVVDVEDPGFAEAIRQHFKLLPTRYALDVNIEGLDVLSHKKLLEEARSNPESLAFQVRQVEVLLPRAKDSPAALVVETPSPPETFHAEGVAAYHGAYRRTGSGTVPGVCRPAFASSPNLQAMLLDSMDHEEASDDGTEAGDLESMLFFEITVGAKDQPKLLSKLSRALADAGMNIKEAHVFNTHDKFSLDVFVADGWEGEAKEGLEDILKVHFSRQLKVQGDQTEDAAVGSLQLPPEELALHGTRRDSGADLDDWEIDISSIQIISRLAAGSFGNLYKALYYGQEVAVKVIKDVQEDVKQFQEFMQEVAIMRKVRHKNVVQFIGACTSRPNLCILFEYMSGGSVHDHLKKEGPMSMLEILKLALDVARGMYYLHQRNIIHRDLKTANLLLDENGNVKIGDFGVSRIIEQSGCMTAETGTYRWMAPEVIEHRAYDCKADVFSFGVLLWELLTAEVPYVGMTPLQAAVGVVQKGLRPEIPTSCPSALANLIRRCWEKHSVNRPSFSEMIPMLQELYDQLKCSGPQAKSLGPKSGLLSRLRSMGNNSGQ